MWYVSVSSCLEAYVCVLVHYSSHQHENQFTVLDLYRELTVALDAKGIDG